MRSEPTKIPFMTNEAVGVMPNSGRNESDGLDMHFAWSAESRERLARAQRFAEERLAPRPASMGLDRDGWSEAAGFGIFRFAASSDAHTGGALMSAAVLEAMGRGGAGRGLLFALGAHLFGCLVPFAAYATPVQRAEWEKKLRDGNAICALAVTEPAGGSSLDHIATEALATAGGFRLTGHKTLVGNAPDASLVIVLARHSGQRGPMSLTAFLVPARSPGISILPSSAVGLASAPIGAIRLDDCFVPDGAVLGRTGSGFRVFSTAMLWERACLLAGFLGAAERDLKTCVDFLSARRDAAGALLRHQAVAHRLARMRLSLDSARLMLYRAAWSIDQGINNQAVSAMAKLAVSEAVAGAAEDTFRLLAGAGWRGEVGDVAAGLTDALGGLLASGTSEIQLEIVARRLQAERAVA
jgi:alkylation response protein AidB-like acyl-CoA dehydrogenase